MKKRKLVVEVYRGIVDIKENKDNITVAIYDFNDQNNDIEFVVNEETFKNGPSEVLIEVFEGLAECTKKPNDVEVLIEVRD